MWRRWATNVSFLSLSGFLSLFKFHSWPLDYLVKLPSIEGWAHRAWFLWPILIHSPVFLRTSKAACCDPQWKVGGGVGKYDSYLGKPGNLVKCILNKSRYLCVIPMHIKIPQTCYWSTWEVQLQLLFRHQLLQAMSSCEYRLGYQSGFVLNILNCLVTHCLGFLIYKKLKNR